MRKGITMQRVIVLGMPLERWRYKSCTCDVASEETWATIYFVQSLKEGQGHCTVLLKHIKEYYEGRFKRFSSSVALNPRMKSILVKLSIEEKL